MTKRRKQKGAVLDPELDKIGYDKIPTYILMVFWFYVAQWFIQLGVRIHILGAIRIELLLALVLVGLSFLMPRQRIRDKCNLTTYIAWYYVIVAIQVPFSHDFATSWLIFNDRFLKFSFMAFFIVVFVRSPLALRIFFSAFLIACFKLGQEGLVGQITGSLVWENQGVMRLNGPTPLYSHPNSFSGMALGTLPFIFYFFPLSNKWLKLFFLILAIFSFNIILHAGSRTTYIGFFIFVFHLFLKSKYKFKAATIGILIFSIAIPFIPSQYIDRFKSIGGEEKEGHSKEKREQIIWDALEIFAEHPFGVGVAAFPKVRSERFNRYQDTHNLYLELATNLGIQGFIVWLLMIFAIFRNIGRLMRVIREQIERMIARAPPNQPAIDAEAAAKHVNDLKLMLAVLNAISCYLVIRLAVGFLGHDTYEIYWWLVMGTVIAVHNLSVVAARITDYFCAKADVSPAHNETAAGRLGMPDDVSNGGVPSH